jgi:hypothetical protein
MAMAGLVLDSAPIRLKFQTMDNPNIDAGKKI